MDLSEHNHSKKYVHCATCGGLLGNTYYAFTSETLPGTAFYELDGSVVLPPAKPALTMN